LALAGLRLDHSVDQQDNLNSQHDEPLPPPTPTPRCLQEHLRRQVRVGLIATVQVGR
jgi:hypothetical protein